MEEFIIKKIEYNETFLRIIVSDINRIFAYWNISKEYDNNIMFKNIKNLKDYENTNILVIKKKLHNYI